MKGLTKTALVLANIGALNWGLQALGWNAVDSLGFVNWLPTLIYFIIGLCGILGLYKLFSK